VSALWVYWSCGQTGPAGLYNKRTGAKLRVPAGRSLLGDGYLVQAKPASSDSVHLVLYAIRSHALGTPVDLATIPAGPAADSRNITWAVDKYSGDIAYVDASDAVHVVDAGVPGTSAANQVPHDQTYWLQAFGNQGNVVGTIEPSRPITRWTVQIRYLHGPVIGRISGSAARMIFRVPWNGMIDGGLKAFSGHYAWTAEATVPGSVTMRSLGHGIVTAYCGRIPFRSEDCDGQSALLLISRPSNHLTQLQAFWYEGTLGGQLRGRFRKGFDGGWPECFKHSHVACVRTFVPFGDFNGDGFGDLLVKYSNGTMRAFLGQGAAQFAGAKSVRVGTNWSKVTMMAAPGDLNADGWPDLVAKDRAGRLWLYRGTGHSHFMPRLRIGGGWNKYTRLIGAGNLTGTGATAETGPGSLLAVTKSGTMWRFSGNGHAGFKRAVRVGGTWNSYDAIVGIGDLNHDGRNDLVARDMSGRLWFFAGTGHGGFARRTLLGKNFGRWRAIY